MTHYRIIITVRLSEHTSSRPGLAWTGERPVEKYTFRSDVRTERVRVTVPSIVARIDSGRARPSSRNPLQRGSGARTVTARTGVCEPQTPTSGKSSKDREPGGNSVLPHKSAYYWIGREGKLFLLSAKGSNCRESIRHQSGTGNGTIREPKSANGPIIFLRKNHITGDMLWLLAGEEGLEGDTDE